MKKFLFFIWILAVFVSFQKTFANPVDYKDIKGLDLTEEGYEDLNPLLAIPWLDGILENHGELLPKDHPLRKLILLLFHRAGAFGLSTFSHKKSVVPHLTPETIGKILGILSKMENSNEDFQTSSKGKEKESLALDENELKDHLNKIFRTFEGKEFPAKGKEYSEFRTAKNNIIKSLINLQKYPEDMHKAYRVFQCVLWYKLYQNFTNEEVRMGIWKYYTAVHSENPFAIHLPEGEEKIKEWISLKFENENIKKEPDIAKLDEFLLWLYRQHQSSPPLEEQGESCYLNHKYPDCGGTSFRNFFMLLSDLKGEYDVAILQNLDVDVEVFEFFKSFKTRERQRSQEARNAWAKIVSGRQSVNYLRETYEISPSSKDILGLFDSLFPNSKISSWEELEDHFDKKLGSEKFKIIQQNLSSDGFGSLDFSIGNLSFRWNFEKIHTYIEALLNEFAGTLPKRAPRDILIYYKQDNKEFADMYYTNLRTNEKIEEGVKNFSGFDEYNIDIAMSLVKRLTTVDAEERVFAKAIANFKIPKSFAKDFKLKRTFIHSLVKNEEYEKAKKLSNLISGKNSFDLIGPSSSELTDIALSPDGKELFTINKDSQLHIWSIDSGSLIRTVQIAKEVGYYRFLGMDGESILLSKVFHQVLMGVILIDRRSYDFEFYDIAPGVSHPGGVKVISKDAWVFWRIGSAIKFLNLTKQQDYIYRLNHYSDRVLSWSPNGGLFLICDKGNNPFIGIHKIESKELDLKRVESSFCNLKHERYLKFVDNESFFFLEDKKVSFFSTKTYETISFETDLENFSESDNLSGRFLLTRQVGSFDNAVFSFEGIEIFNLKGNKLFYLDMKEKEIYLNHISPKMSLDNSKIFIADKTGIVRVFLLPKFDEQKGYPKRLVEIIRTQEIKNNLSSYFQDLQKDDSGDVQYLRRGHGLLWFYKEDLKKPLAETIQTVEGEKFLKENGISEKMSTEDFLKEYFDIDFE